MKLVLFLFFGFVSVSLNAQTEYLGTTTNYSNSTAQSLITTYGGTAKWVRNGVNIGSGSSVNISWNSLGVNNFSCLYSGVTWWSSFPVTDYSLQNYIVNVVASPPTPSATVSSSSTCAAITIAQSTTLLPSERYEWWWQTSPTGTSTSLGNSTSLILNYSSNVYLRSRLKISPYTWSDNSQSLGNFVLASVAAPVQLTTTANTCGPKTVSFNAPSSDVTYYWQDTYTTGTSVSTPLNSAYTIGVSGDYYIRAKCNLSSNWSPSTKVSASIDPVDITLTTYEPANSLVQATHSITLGPGFIVPAGSTFNARILITSECNDFVNWTEQIAYDQNGQPISDGRSYQDGFGKTILSESIDLLSGKVWASQPLYDNLNNPSASTMPAPILESGFIYKNNFVQNSSNQIYSANDFDKPVVSNLTGELNNPVPVGKAAGTLGWYYSSDNNLEPATPTTQFPYSRSYTPPGPNPTTSKSAGVGENNKMGSGHEVSSARHLIAVGELSHYDQFRKYYGNYTLAPNLLEHVTTSSSSQFIGQNATVKPGVLVTSTGGSSSGVTEIGGAISVTPGKTYIYKLKGYNKYVTLPGGGLVNNAVSLLVTANTGTLIVWPGPDLSYSSNWATTTFTVPAGVTSIKVGAKWSVIWAANYSFQIEAVDLREDLPIVSQGYKVISTDPNGKQATSYTDADGRSLASVTDGKWSYTYYNDVGQAVATVAPNGINTSINSLNFITSYKYDQLGRLIETTSPDEGMSQFVYSTDGKIRFSQNQLQRDASPKRFSYTNYDYLGRLIESGEYEASGTAPFTFEPHSTLTTPVATSVLNIIDNVGYTGITGQADARCRETNFIQYDIPASDYPTDVLHPAQSYMTGQVARTKNENTTTWYSYDEFGQLATMKQALPFGQPQSVQWTNLVNVTVNGNSLTNTVSGWGNNGAFSINSIPANTDGYLEFKSGIVSGDFAIGLSSTDATTNLYSINYGLFLQGGNIWVLENNNGGPTPRSTYTTSDILRVERRGTTIVFLKNGVIFYTSAISSSSPLYADCSFNTGGGIINTISMGSSNFTRLSSLQWTNLVNVAQSGTTLTKTSGNGNAWDAGAFSIPSIPANGDGYLEFTAGEATTYKMMGLSSTDGDASYATINYAIYPEAGGNIQIYENGILRGAYGTYTTTDLFRVERQGSSILYKKNEATFFTSAVPSTGALYGDCSFYNTTSSIKNTSVSLPNSQPQNLPQSLQWTNLVNTTQSGNGISKTAGNGSQWDAGAFSMQSIPANTNGWLEFQAGETNTYKMMGLSATDANVSYTNINYALYPAGDGNLYVYENNTPINPSRSYATTDVFRIERQGSTIFYKQNGGVIYTSTISSTSVLFADCTLADIGSSFKNISLSLPTTIKTIDYTYDYFGNVTQVAYQQGQPKQSDAFFHHYEYDKNNRLTVASTSLDGTTKSVQAKYFYYLHGPLKRVELGNNAQGIDYVYNLDGSLKFINHPDPTKDIGKDGLSGVNAGFQPDVFGMALDYNANDYVPANYADAGTFSNPGAPGQFPDQFGGAIRSTRWHSPTDSHVPRGYAYFYDSQYQLTSARFGNITGSGSYSMNFPTPQPYWEAINGYDNNGNIEGLVRSGKTGQIQALYGYNYAAGTNKLTSVNNTNIDTQVTSNLLNYQYNSIGQLIQQTEGANTMNITYTAYGLTKEIRDGTNQLKASYVYDDRGNRVKKTTYNAAGAPEHITIYVSDAAGNTLATYEQDVAGGGSMYLTEVPVYAAGRVGIYKPLANFTFYEVNDHLGNVRGVIGSPGPFTYTATLEDNGQAVYTNPRVQEMAYFKNLSTTAVTAPYMNHTASSTYVPAPNTSSYTYWMNGSPGNTPDIKSIGPAIGITVQPGDKLDMEAYVKFEKKASYSRAGIVGAMSTLLGNGFLNTAPGLEIVSNASQIFNNGLTSAVSATTLGNGNDPNTLPYAYLYYMLYDRNFNFVTAGWKRVTMDAGFNAGAEITSVHERLAIPQITITDPGYMYIFVANESEITRVWFDDLKVTHQRSNIVAGADYYPFGLPMENREITREDYRYGYQGQYSEKDKETGWNAFELRMYDARVARWLSVDPQGQYFSPYVGMGNNPVTGTDPDGGYCTTCLFETMQYINKMMGTVLAPVTVTATILGPTFAEKALKTTAFILNGMKDDLLKAFVSTGKFANGANHILTGGLMPLEKTSSGNQQFMQDLGQGTAAVVVTAMSQGRVSPGSSSVLATPTMTIPVLKPVDVPVSTTLSVHGTVNSKSFPKEFDKELQKIKNGQGTPRKDGNGNQKIFEGRELTGAQKWKWQGSLEWDVPGTNHRILQKINSDGSSTFGRVVNHNYNTIYPF